MINDFNRAAHLRVAHADVAHARDSPWPRKPARDGPFAKETSSLSRITPKPITLFLCLFDKFIYPLVLLEFLCAWPDDSMHDGAVARGSSVGHQRLMQAKLTG